MLAAELEYESGELAFSLASNAWWAQRTQEVVAGAAAGAGPAGAGSSRPGAIAM
jgi:hypothetical protein